VLKGVYYKQASIIFSTLLLLFPAVNTIYSTHGFFGVRDALKINQAPPNARFKLTDLKNE